MYPAGAMQDRFVGDIGDFGKYGLLRALTGLWPPLPPKDRLSLGVVWYYREEKGLDYLRKSDEYRACDEELFPQLGKIVAGSTRTIAQIEESGILGSETSFYSTPVPPGKNQRESWLSVALKLTNGNDIVFIDPDNGIQFNEKMSSKHARISEVKQFPIHEQTIIIYQSFWRQKQDEQMMAWAEEIHLVLQTEEPPKIVRFGSRNPRAFIILPAARHAKLIDERLAKMLDGPWSQHFTLHAAGG